MCGLFGHGAADCEELEHSRASLNTLIHRGPDQWGEWTGDGLYIGHRRLSILDLSEAGRQPMVSADGQVILSANGEIYNFRELKRELQGHAQFTSESDSEVLLHGYRHWGIEGLLMRLDGMFAFSVYDRSSRTLVLARDHVGIKPLYYGMLDRQGESPQCVWASELKAIQYFAPDALSVDSQALYDFLTYLCIPCPKSLYKEIYKLPPAHYATHRVGSGEWQVRRYWQLKTEVDDTITLDEASRTIREKVRAAVDAQMVADVPVGFFLSGGIDSSIVVAEAASLTNKPHTFTIGFDDKGRDESPYAQMAAEHTGTEHIVRYFKRDDSLEHLSQLKTWYDEPYGDTSAFPSYLVAKVAREQVIVVLTGDGGDELFGGYRWYREFGHFWGWRQSWAHCLQPLIQELRRRGGTSLPGKAANRLEFYLFKDPFALYSKLIGGLPDSRRKAHYRSLWEIPQEYDDYWHYRVFWREDLPLITRLQYLDFHTYLPDDILTKVDRVTMAVSLESRVPLLAKDVVEYLFHIPESVRLTGDTSHNWQSKGLMKHAWADTLPAKILNRGKRGFSVPPGKLAALKRAHNSSIAEVLLEELFPEYVP